MRRDMAGESEREATAPAGEMEPKSDAATSLPLPLVLRSLRHRNFRLFFSGQLISLIGTWMQMVAQSWLVYRLTGSAALLGLVGFSSQFPVFLLSAVGGVLADRYDRRKVVMMTQAASMLLALTLAALTLSHSIQIWQIITIAAMLGVVNAADVPARQSFFVELVGREDLINAIALNSSMFNAARVVGPAVAGLLVAAIGEGWCFLANGVSYIAVIAGLLMMDVKPRHIAEADNTPLERIREGFRFSSRNIPVRALLLLLGLVSLMGMPYVVLMPIFADVILHGGARGLGLLMGASGVGALIGALMVASRTGVRGLGRLVAYCSAGFGVSLIAFAFSRLFWLSAAILVVTGFSLMMQMASSNTLIQTMVPDELRGRVMSVYSMMVMGMAPFGSLLAGGLAHPLGAPMTVALGGGACILGSLVFWRNLPAIRVAARLLIAQQSEQ